MHRKSRVNILGAQKTTKKVSKKNTLKKPINQTSTHGEFKMTPKEKNETV